MNKHNNTMPLNDVHINAMWKRTSFASLFRLLSVGRPPPETVLRVACFTVIAKSSMRCASLVEAKAARPCGVRAVWRGFAQCGGSGGEDQLWYPIRFQTENRELVVFSNRVHYWEMLIDRCTTLHRAPL